MRNWRRGWYSVPIQNALASGSKCVYCTDACGKHRCVRYCEAKNLTVGDVDAYRWAPSSFYNLDGHDIEATVLQMLRHASSSTITLAMLKSLRENDVVPENKYTCLQKFVLANTGAVYDADPTHGRPNQSLVLSHASFRPAVTTSKSYLEAQKKKLLEKLQKVWDVNRNSYRHYADVSPSRSVPIQLHTYATYCSRRYSNYLRHREVVRCRTNHIVDMPHL